MVDHVHVTVACDGNHGHLVVMQNMLSHHHGNASDRDVISAALGAMKGVTQKINELKRQHERSVRAVEIQRLLEGWSRVELALLGELIMEVRYKLPHLVCLTSFWQPSSSAADVGC